MQRRQPHRGLCVVWGVRWLHGHAVAHLQHSIGQVSPQQCVTSCSSHTCRQSPAAPNANRQRWSGAYELGCNVPQAITTTLELGRCLPACRAPLGGMCQAVQQQAAGGHRSGECRRCEVVLGLLPHGCSCLLCALWRLLLDCMLSDTVHVCHASGSIAWTKCVAAVMNVAGMHDGQRCTSLLI